MYHCPVYFFSTCFQTIPFSKKKKKNLEKGFYGRRPQMNGLINDSTVHIQTQCSPTPEESVKYNGSPKEKRSTLLHLTTRTLLLPIINS